MKITGISASSYDKYDWCEWAWFLSYILGFEDVSGPAALLGTMAHKILEVLSRASLAKVDKSHPVFDVERLWNIWFNYHYNKFSSVASEITDDKLRKVCRGIHQLLAGDYTPIRDNTVSAEAKFDIPIQGKEFLIPKEFLRDPNEIRYFTLRGRIDRVDRLSEDTIEVVDYKSGSRVCWDSKDRHKKTSDDLREEIQPRMYHLAAQHLYPWAKNFLVTFIYFTDGGPVTVPFCEEDIQITKDILLRRFRTIRNNADPQRNQSWKCNKMCSFGQTGLCDQVWKEKNEVGHEFLINKYTILNNRKY